MPLVVDPPRHSLKGFGEPLPSFVSRVKTSGQGLNQGDCLPKFFGIELTFLIREFGCPISFLILDAPALLLSRLFGGHSYGNQVCGPRWRGLGVARGRFLCAQVGRNAPSLLIRLEATRARNSILGGGEGSAR